MKSALLRASVAIVLSLTCEASRPAPDTQTLSMAGALTLDNTHPFEQVQSSMADMLAQAQASGIGDKVLFNTIEKPPVRLLELVSMVRARLNKAGIDPAKLPVQGYDGHDHKEVDVKKVNHKDMESITGDWSHEYGPNMGSWKESAGSSDPNTAPQKSDGHHDIHDLIPGKSASGPIQGLGLTAISVAFTAFVCRQ